MKRSRAFTAARKMRGGYGVPAGKRPALRTSGKEILNRKLKRPALPSIDTPVTIGERIKSALKTEARGQVERLKKYMSDPANRSRAAERAKSAYITRKENERIRQEMKDSMYGKKPKTSTSTVPLIDNENGSVVSVRGRMKQDKITTATTVKVDMSGPVKQRSFNTSIRFGRPTSKALLQAAKMNGTKTVNLWNSLTDANFKNPANNHKEYCEMVTGFGQKMLYASNYLAPSWKSIYSDIYKVTVDTVTDPNALNPDAADSTKDLSLYGCALNVNSKITLRNNMNTTSAVVKIHFVTLKDRRGNSAPYNEPIYSLPTLGGMNGIEDQRVLVAPTVYPRPNYRNSGTFVAGTAQWGPQTTDSHATVCYVAPGVDIRESARWNDKFMISKTLTKTLDVGDDWTLNINRTLGSGLKLDEALRSGANLSQSSINQATVPFGHRIIVEMYGKKIVAETNYADTYTGSTTTAVSTQTFVTGGDKYIASAPCSVSWEASHYISYVLQSYSGLPSSLNETNFNSRVGGPLIRSYEKDLTVTNTPFHMDYWKTNGDTTYLAPLKIQSATTATVQTVTTTT